MERAFVRRDVVRGLATVAVAAATACRAGAARRTVPSFGAAVRQTAFDDGPLSSLIATTCATVTPELELKWAAVERQHGTFTFSGADRIAAFAKSHAMAMRGHTLVWHGSIPDWAEPLLVPGADWSLVGRYMEAAIRRFDGHVRRWDVVNEPIAPEDGFDGRRVSPFYAAWGSNYVFRALEHARAATLRGRLFIGEYGLEYANPLQAARRDALLALVREARRAKVPLDGIGLQTHLDLRTGPFDPQVYRDFLQALADEGLALCITELDVKERDYPQPIERRDQLVADHAARVLDVALAQPALEEVTCWGLSDRQSWLRVEPRDYASFPNYWQDGSSPGLNRGLPFSADLQPKPLWHVLESRISQHGKDI